MVESAAIERVVKQCAGRPGDVVDALVEAANDAGGVDNITVVYAEAPGFATAAAASAVPVPAPRGPGPVVRFARWAAASRTTWFAIGTFAGVVGALVLAWWAGSAGAAAGRTLVVGPAEVATFARIEDAMRSARAGDVVQLEPGVYAERIVVPDGVDLVAREPGSVTVTRGPGVAGEWIAVTTAGTSSGRISGLRIESTPEHPIDVGLHVSGQGGTIQLVDVTGAMRAGIELGPASAVSIRGSLLAVHGPAVTLDEGAQATLTNNTFLHAGRSAEAPIAIVGAAQLIAARNVFAGFGKVLVKAPSDDDWRQILIGNVVVAAEPSIGR
jgi:hypothetical protein